MPVSWLPIDDSETPNWTPVDDSNTITWGAISPSGTPSWTPVDDLSGETYGTYADAPFADIPFTGTLRAGDNGWDSIDDTQTNNWTPVT